MSGLSPTKTGATPADSTTHAAYEEPSLPKAVQRRRRDDSDDDDDSGDVDGATSTPPAAAAYEEPSLPKAVRRRRHGDSDDDGDGEDAGAAAGGGCADGEGQYEEPQLPKLVASARRPSRRGSAGYRVKAPAYEPRASDGSEDDEDHGVGGGGGADGGGAAAVVARAAAARPAAVSRLVPRRRASLPVPRAVPWPFGQTAARRPAARPHQSGTGRRRARRRVEGAAVAGWSRGAWSCGTTWPHLPSTRRRPRSR